jgi:hypothetical protein
MVVTYTRCLHFFYQDAPAEAQARFTPGFLHLMADLGITAFSDLERRREQVLAFLPTLWTVAEEIVDANPDVEDDFTEAP